MATSRQPLDLQEQKIPKGQVHVIPSRCKGCRFCIEFCPRDVLAESSAINAKGYHYPVVSQGKDDACTQCEFCRLVCPELAIYTEDAARG